MPPDQHSRDPAAWLTHAEEDLEVARGEKLAPRVRCDHAHKTAEKALKALCLARGMEVKYTHSLRKLLANLQADGQNIPPDIAAARTLDAYAGDARYPMRGPAPAFHPEAAAEMARAMLDWASDETARARARRRA